MKRAFPSMSTSMFYNSNSSNSSNSSNGNGSHSHSHSQSQGSDLLSTSHPGGNTRTALQGNSSSNQIVGKGLSRKGSLRANLAVSAALNQHQPSSHNIAPSGGNSRAIPSSELSSRVIPNSVLSSESAIKLNGSISVPISDDIYDSPKRSEAKTPSIELAPCTPIGRSPVKVDESSIRTPESHCTPSSRSVMEEIGRVSNNSNHSLPSTHSSIGRSANNNNCFNSTLQMSDITMMSSNYSFQSENSGSRLNNYIESSSSMLTNEMDGTLLSSNSSSSQAELSMEGMDVTNAKGMRSMCFAFQDGKVSSVSITSDGCYVIISFASGLLRLFDLTEGGNTEPEDRWGHVLATMNGSSNGNHGLHQGVTLQASSILVDYGDQKVSHIFFGTCNGNHGITIVDLESMKESRRRRGFLTTVGASIHAYHHFHRALKGISAVRLSHVLHKRPQARQDQNKDALQESQTPISIPEDPSEEYHEAVYHIICGKTLLVVNIWEVRLIRHRPLGHENFQYEDYWTLLNSGHVPCPSVAFSTFLTLPLASLWAEFSPSTSLRTWDDSSRKQHQEEEKPIRSSSSSSSFNAVEARKNPIFAYRYSVESVDEELLPKHSMLEFLVRAGESNARRGVLDVDNSCGDRSNDQDASGSKMVVSIQSSVGETVKTGGKTSITKAGGLKMTSIANTDKILGSSLDGSVLFGGGDTLSVYRLFPQIRSSSKIEKDCGSDFDENLAPQMAGKLLLVQKFSLSSFSSSSMASASSTGVSNTVGNGGSSMMPLSNLNSLSSHTLSSSGMNGGNGMNDFPSHRKRSRHLREVKTISCTNDGSYALITTTENSVFLYSPCDIFGCGIPNELLHISSSVASTTSNPATESIESLETILQAYHHQMGGFLTHLFQVQEDYRLELSIARVSDLGVAIPCSCTFGGIRGGSFRHESPQSIAVAIAWWDNSTTSYQSKGHIRTVRLGDCTNHYYRSAACLEDLIPFDICYPDVGLASNYFSRHKLPRHAVQSCILCHSRTTPHWNEVLDGNEWMDTVDDAADPDSISEDDTLDDTVNNEENENDVDDDDDDDVDDDDDDMRDQNDVDSDGSEEAYGKNRHRGRKRAFIKRFSSSEPKKNSRSGGNRRSLQVTGKHDAAIDLADQDFYETGRKSLVYRRSSSRMNIEEDHDGFDENIEDEGDLPEGMEVSRRRKEQPREKSSQAGSRGRGKSKSLMNDQFDDLIQSYEEKIKQLELSIRDYSDQANLCLRKADKRFAEEMKVRRSFNRKFDDLNRQKLDVIRDLSYWKAEAVKLREENQRILSHVTTLVYPLSQLCGMVQRSRSSNDELPLAAPAIGMKTPALMDRVDGSSCHNALCNSNSNSNSSNSSSSRSGMAASVDEMNLENVPIDSTRDTIGTDNNSDDINAKNEVEVEVEAEASGNCSQYLPSFGGNASSKGNGNGNGNGNGTNNSNCSNNSDIFHRLNYNGGNILGDEVGSRNTLCNNTNNNSACNSVPFGTIGCSSSIPSIRAYFCVVCQEFTADVIILHCGHVCLCYRHALEMDASLQLLKCPLCSESCAGYCKLSGVERLD